MTKSDYDPVAVQREVILTSVQQLLREADVVLIKGQDWDIDANRLRRLKTALPGAHHRIIFLRCTFATLWRRVRHKSWWRPFITRRLAKRWLLWQATALHQIEHEFDIQAVDGGSRQRYRHVKFTKTGLPSHRHLLKRGYGLTFRQRG